MREEPEYLLTRGGVLSLAVLEGRKVRMKAFEDEDGWYIGMVVSVEENEIPELYKSLAYIRSVE